MQHPAKAQAARPVRAVILPKNETVRYNAPMTTADSRRKSITESPWYWACLFCTAALVALVLMGPKFEVRQAQIERQYQGRERALQQKAGEAPSTPMSTAGDTYISLKPLSVALAVLLAIAWPVLWWRHFRRRPEEIAGPSELPADTTSDVELAGRNLP